MTIIFPNRNAAQEHVKKEIQRFVKMGYHDARVEYLYGSGADGSLQVHCKFIPGKKC